MTFINYQAPFDERFKKVNDYIADMEAFQKFGKNGKHMFGVFRDDSATNEVELYNNTKKKLEELSKPKLVYSCSVITLENLIDYAHEKVRIGDTILVKDWSFSEPLILEARIMELRRSKTTPNRDSVILGDYVAIQFNRSNEIQRLQQMIRNNENQWNQINQEISDLEIGAYNYFHNSSFKNGFEYYTVEGIPSIVGVTDLTGFSQACMSIIQKILLVGTDS